MALPLRAKTDKLGRYYTCPNVGSLLIDQMPNIAPQRVLDLGSGSGILSRAAAVRWSNAEFITVDVDSSLLNPRNSSANSIARNHKHLCSDALSINLPTLLASQHGEIQAGICNPPFILPQWRDGFANILEDAGFSNCLPTIASADAALLFLAQNLRLLVEGATLGIILPDSLISAEKYRSFRRALITQYQVLKSIKLPRNSFVGTDALAHILIISKSKPSSGFINLAIFDSKCGIVEDVDVDLEAAVERLDCSYHAVNSRFKGVSFPMSLVIDSLKRGSLSSSAARTMNFKVLHTTDINGEKLGQWIDFSKFGDLNLARELDNMNLIYAKPGDILLARIGRNLEKKIVGISAGYPVLTDCMYRLRVSSIYRRSILTQLSSESGAAWLRARGFGVSAQQIPKSGLLEFPIVLSNK